MRAARDVVQHRLANDAADEAKPPLEVRDATRRRVDLVRQVVDVRELEQASRGVEQLADDALEPLPRYAACVQRRLALHARHADGTAPCTAAARGAAIHPSPQVLTSNLKRKILLKSPFCNRMIWERASCHTQ